MHRSHHAYAAEPRISNQSLKDHLKEAQTSYKEGRYEEAISFWNEALSVDPDNQKAKKGIEKAKEKIEKIKDFFGKDVFEDFGGTHRFTLQNCIEIAEASNLSLKIAKEQITLSEIKVWEARRAFFPSLTLSWAETKGIRTGGKVEGIEYGVEGRQPAFHSGELIYTLAQSKANFNIAEENYAKVKSELDFEVAETYFLFVKAGQTLEYTKALYEDTKPFYEMAQEKYDKAVVADIEHLNAASKINQIYYKSISAESDFKLAKLALEQKLNMEDVGDIETGSNIALKGMDKDMATCLSLAIKQRPDLKMSELTVKSTEYGKKIVQAKEMPRVDLAGHYKKFSEVYKKSFSPLNTPASLDPRRKWYAGIEVVWPFLGNTGTYSLYKREDPSTLSTYDPSSESKGTTWKLGILDNLKQFTESQEAEIAKARAEEDLDEMRKKVIMEVKEAFYDYEKARIQLESAGSQREFKEKEVKILKLKHGAGEIELSELLGGIVDFMEASEAYFEAERGLNASIAKLNKAVGIQNYF